MRVLGWAFFGLAIIVVLGYVLLVSQRSEEDRRQRRINDRRAYEVEFSSRDSCEDAQKSVIASRPPLSIRCGNFPRIRPHGALACEPRWPVGGRYGSATLYQLVTFSGMPVALSGGYCCRFRQRAALR